VSDPTPATVEAVAPGVVRVRADNPGPMTLDGTNTWLLYAPGAGGAVVVDPGPDDPDHHRRVRDELTRADVDVALVLLTHGHLDHSEGAAGFARSVAAPLRAVEAQWSTAATLQRDEVLDVDGLSVEVLATPGHTSDSVSFAVGSHLLTGDTVLGRGTTVVAHPDGRLADYLASLAALRDRAEQHDVTHLLPGHGPTVTEPLPWLDFYLAHRRDRLAAVAEAVRTLGTSPASGDEADLDQTVADVVARVYADVPRHLWPAAALSVRAQLLYLRDA
jgi:glyoxylase-like metal-dependent hydrolase (beta-lactamase superfamily II)